jgi:hypothetical protein
MTVLTKDTAVDKLMHIPHQELIDLCQHMYIDQYGYKNSNMTNMSVPELVSWIITHYEFDVDKQALKTIVPFEE